MSSLVQVMRKELKKISQDASVREAARRMRDERVGSLFVERGGTLVGILTETEEAGREMEAYYGDIRFRERCCH